MLDLTKYDGHAKDLTLEVVKTSIGSCIRIGPLPRSDRKNSPDCACIYADGIHAYDFEYSERYKKLLATGHLFTDAPLILAELKEAREQLQVERDGNEQQVEGMNKSLHESETKLKEARAEIERLKAGPPPKPVTQISTWYMHDNHTFSRLSGSTPEEIVESAKAMVKKSPDGMLCGAILKYDDGKEHSRIGENVHSRRTELNDASQWIEAVKANPDAVRLLAARKAAGMEETS